MTPEASQRERDLEAWRRLGELRALLENADRDLAAGRIREGHAHVRHALSVAMREL